MSSIRKETRKPAEMAKDVIYIVDNLCQLSSEFTRAERMGNEIDIIERNLGHVYAAKVCDALHLRGESIHVV